MLANHGALSASAIASNFHISTAAISQHLKVLREAKLVRVEKRAQQRIYRVDPEAIRALERWAHQMSQSYDSLDKLISNTKEN